MLQKMIDNAWSEYNALHEQEAATGYEDSTISFERKEAEGYATGLEAAFVLVFNESPENNVEPSNWID